MWIPEVGGKTELVTKFSLYNVNIQEVKNMDQSTRQKDVVHTEEKINTIITIKTFLFLS